MLLVFFLSALDAFLTLRGVRARLFAELNPLAAWLITRSSAAFVLAKMALALGGFWVLARQRSSDVARVLLAAGLAAYAALDAYWIYLLTR
jgi:hypothetical protein